MNMITNETKEAIQQLISLSYVDNAKIDRMKSVLMADFSYNETAEIVHQYIAHYFSNVIGDLISENCLERYNISVVFGGIPTMDKVYESVSDVLKDLLDVVVNYQEFLNYCIKVANDNYDYHIATDLLEYLKDYNKIVDQCILLVDKIEMYKDNPSFDAHIKESFFILK